MQHWPPDAFPDPDLALDEPNGLLAAGGDLGPPPPAVRLPPRHLPLVQRRARRSCGGRPTPAPSCGRTPSRLSRSLRRTLRRGTFTITGDTAFDRVVHECAAPRARQDGTWITPADGGGLRPAAPRRARPLHRVLARRGPRRRAVRRRHRPHVLRASPMFSRVSDASKAALAHLCTLGFGLIDCQIPNPHLARLGAVEMERRRFLAQLDALCEASGPYEAAGIGTPHRNGAARDGAPDHEGAGTARPRFFATPRATHAATSPIARRGPCSSTPPAPRTRRCTRCSAGPASGEAAPRSTAPNARPRCRACIPVRVPVARFPPPARPSPGSRREPRPHVAGAAGVLRAGALRALPALPLGPAHAGGGMEDHSPLQYLDFLTSPCATPCSSSTRSAARSSRSR